MLVHAIPSSAAYEFAADVRAGLTRTGQKELPSKYLYDNVGSALFEVISYLPEYGLTRADERLLRLALRRHGVDVGIRLSGFTSIAHEAADVADRALELSKGNPALDPPAALEAARQQG